MQDELEMAAAAQPAPSPTFRCVNIPNAESESLENLVREFEDAHPALTRAVLRDIPYEEPVTQQFAVLQVIAVQGYTINERTKQRQWKMDVLEIQPDGCRNRPYMLVLEEFQDGMHEVMPMELRIRLKYFDNLRAPVIVATGFVKEKCSWFATDDKHTLRCCIKNNPQVVVATLPRPLSQPSSSQRSSQDAESDKLCLPNCSYSLPAQTDYRPLSQLTVGGPYALVAVVRYAVPPRMVRSQRGRNEWMQNIGLVDPSLDIVGDAKFKLTLFSAQQNYLPVFASAGDFVVVRNMYVKQPPMRLETVGIGYADSVRFAYVPAASANMTQTIVKNSSTYILQEVDKDIIRNLRDWYQTVASVIDGLEKAFPEAGKGVSETDIGQIAAKPAVTVLPKKIGIGGKKPVTKPPSVTTFQGNRPHCRESLKDVVHDKIEPVQNDKQEKMLVVGDEQESDPEVMEYSEKPLENVPPVQDGTTKADRGEKRTLSEEEADEEMPHTMEFASWNTPTGVQDDPAEITEITGGSIWSEQGMFVEKNADGSVRPRKSVLELADEPTLENTEFTDFVLRLRNGGRNGPLDFKNGDLDACITQ